MKLFYCLGIGIVISSITSAITPSFAQPEGRLKATNLPNMATPVTTDNLDTAAFAEWENGNEKLIQPTSPTDKNRITLQNWRCRRFNLWGFNSPKLASLEGA